MSPRRINLFIACLAGLIGAGLSGCANDKTASAPAVTLPAGIVSGAAIVGIYASGPDEGCCWTGPDVRFPLDASGAPSELVLDVYEPPIGAFAKASQSVSLVNDRGRVVASRTVAPGKETTVTFPLSADDVRNGTVSVHLRMARSYVPKDLGLGPDIRRLALILKRASTR